MEKILANGEFHNHFYSSNTVMVTKSGKMRWVHVVYIVSSRWRQERGGWELGG